MFNTSFAATLAVGLLLSAASAQSYYFPSNTPSTGSCNVIPFGTTATSTTWANQKYQCIATQAELGNTPVGTITEIAFSPCGTGVGNYHFDTIEIVLAQTNQALSTSFAGNLVQNPQVVLQATNYDWNVTGGQWNRLGLDRSYLYIAGNHPDLVIQITVTGADMSGAVGGGFNRDGTHQRLYSFGWTTAAGPAAAGSMDTAALKWEVSFNQADLHTFGVGCAGGNGTPDTPGGTRPATTVGSWSGTRTRGIGRGTWRPSVFQGSVPGLWFQGSAHGARRWRAFGVPGTGPRGAAMQVRPGCCLHRPGEFSAGSRVGGSASSNGLGNSAGVASSAPRGPVPGTSVELRCR